MSLFKPIHFELYLYVCVGKCADSIFFHVKISLTESVTEEISVKKPNKVSKTEKLRYLLLAIF